MKKRQLTAIFSSLIIAALTVSMTGCAGRVYTIDGGTASQAPSVSSAPTVEESKQEESSEEESSEEESSEEESSEEESSEEESSKEESSEEESSEEESSEEESSEEESSEEESSEEEEESGKKVTFIKPDDWSDNIYIVVYQRGGRGEMPGNAMTNNGDGTFSYVLKEDIEDPVAIFHDADDTRTRNKNMYPRSGSIDFVDGETYEVAVG